uniref:PX domain-containing protein n=1 Tax=Gopherus agassizii TaxID=38772 RepID=A0A452J086_9SAUR
MNCCRYPVDVKAVGLMQCRKQKYMMAVSWSDRNNLLIYRTFEEFKKFHKVLKRKFPIEGGLLKKSDRSIPKYCGQGSNAKLMQRRSRNLSRSMERLKLLETYSQELLKADAKVSQSEDVIQFFKAQTQDLDPSFPKNSLSPGFRTNQCQTLLSSIIIMPSEMGDGKKDQFKQQNTSVTQPVVSQNYSCIEAYETKDTKNRPFKVANKEIVEVLIKDVTGWWLVENKDQQIAWFPAPYLEARALSYLQSRNDPFLFLPGTLYYTVRAYKSQKADELSLNVGVVVEVLEKSDNGWWLICKDPHLTSKDRNDSGFEEEPPSDSDSFLHSPDSAASVPKVPVRPTVQEILQKCSTVTKRAVQRAAPRPNLHSSPHLHPRGEMCAKPTDALEHVCLR